MPKPPSSPLQAYLNQLVPLPVAPVESTQSYLARVGPKPFAALARLEEKPPPRKVGLFFEALGGDATALYLDAQQHPERYDADTLRLVIQLVSLARKADDLSPEELERLHLVTASYAAEKSRPLPPPERKAPAATRHHQTLSAEDVFEEDPFAGTDLDIPFWWK